MNTSVRVDPEGVVGWRRGSSSWRTKGAAFSGEECGQWRIEIDTRVEERSFTPDGRSG